MEPTNQPASAASKKSFGLMKPSTLNTPAAQNQNEGQSQSQNSFQSKIGAFKDLKTSKESTTKN
jgi:hypothetical protein